MDCSDCKNKPSFLCRCKNTYLCDTHVVNHLKQNLQHDLENLYTTIDSNDKILLIKELDSRIMTLKKLEQNTIRKTQHFINFIEEKSKKVIQEINHLVNHYNQLKYKNDIEKSKINKIQSIIHSKLSLNYLNTNSIIREIETFYSKPLYDIISDELEINKIRKVNFLQKHCSAFSCLAISSDGKNLISGSDDSCIRIWNLETNSLVSCLTNHKSKVTCLELSLDNDLFISGSRDRTIILWSLKEKSFKRLYSGHSEELSFALFTNESTFILSGSFYMELMLWKTDSSEIIKKINVNSYLSCGTIKSNNFCVLGIGNCFEVWDVKTLTRKLSMFIPNLECIQSLEVTNDCKTVALTAYNDTLIYLYRDANLIAKLTGHSKYVYSISITKDDKILVSGSSDSTIILWSLNDYSLIHKFYSHTKEVFTVKTNGDFIYSGSNDYKILITRISSLSLESSIKLQGYNKNSQIFKNNLTAFGFYEDIFIFDEKYSNYYIVLKGHLNFVNTLQISTSMNLLISSSSGNLTTLILWDLKSLSKICAFESHLDSVNCVDISNNDLYAISGDNSGVVILWNISNLNQEINFKGHEGRVLCVKFNENNRYAASGGSDKRFCVWNINEKILTTVINHTVINNHQFSIRKIWLSDDFKYFVYQIDHEEKFIWNINEVRLEGVLKDESQSKSFFSEYKKLEAQFILDF